MAFTYTQIDRKRVEVNVAAAFYRMKADFEKAFPGITLHVRSGTRTWREQYDLWIKYKNGGTLALHPDNIRANHVETNPTGPRALDIHDSGKDAGVTRAGNARSSWIERNASRYGFDPAGYGFSQVEPWHIEYRGKLSTGESTAGGESSKPVTPNTTDSKEDEMALRGAYYTRGGKSVFLLFDTASGFYVEHSGVDATYNNPIATRWETNSWANITEAHAVVIKRGLDRLQKTTVSGSLSVDLSEDPAGN